MNGSGGLVRVGLASEGGSLPFPILKYFICEVSNCREHVAGEVFVRFNLS